MLNMNVLSLSIAGLFYVCLWTDPKSSKPFFSIRNHPCPDSKISHNEPKDELEVALKKASMPNKTLIIAVVNKAYVEQNNDTYPTMLDLFLESFWLGENTRSLLDHLLIVALDQTAYDRCKFRRLHCYKLETADEGVNLAGEKIYKSGEFIKMMWRRTLFLLDVLKHGYNFIFTDSDIMWLRNPFSRLSNDPSEDLQISTDWFDGNPWSENSMINTGFYYIKSNPKTISLFQTWYNAGLNSTTGETEQYLLAHLMHQGAFKMMGLKVRFLDTNYFSGFCVRSKNVTVMTTIHANCCVGIAAKVVDLTAVLEDWKSFKGVHGGAGSEGNSSINGYATYQESKHFACKRSMKMANMTMG